MMTDEMIVAVAGRRKSLATSFTFELRLFFFGCVLVEAVCLKLVRSESYVRALITTILTATRIVQGRTLVDVVPVEARLILESCATFLAFEVSLVAVCVFMPCQITVPFTFVLAFPSVFIDMATHVVELVVVIKVNVVLQLFG